MIFAAILFGVLKAGATMVNQSTTIPFEFVDMVQALVVVFVAAPSIILSPIQKIRSIIKKKDSGPAAAGQGGAE